MMKCDFSKMRQECDHSAIATVYINTTEMINEGTKKKTLNLVRRIKNYDESRVRFYGRAAVVLY